MTYPCIALSVRWKRKNGKRISGRFSIAKTISEGQQLLQRWDSWQLNLEWNSTTNYLGMGQTKCCLSWVWSWLFWWSHDRLFSSMIIWTHVFGSMGISYICHSRLILTIQSSANAVHSRISATKASFHMKDFSFNLNSSWSLLHHRDWKSNIYSSSSPDWTSSSPSSDAVTSKLRSYCWSNPK